MLHSPTEVVCYAIIVCCGGALGYIIGHARGKRLERKLILEDNFPLLKAPEIAN